jgi:hypothetical protein
MRAVRRRFAYLIAWTLATTVTVGASWLGIRSVLDAAAPSRSMPLSAADLRRAAPTSVAPTAPLPTSTPDGAGSPAPTPSANASGSPAATPSATPTADGWRRVSGGSDGTAYERTFRLRGGVVTLRVAAGDVRVVAADPGPGYVVATQRLDAQSVLISFMSGEHTSRLFGAWRDGPYAEVTESVD